MSSYSDQLKHPLWQKKRLEIMSRDGFKCCDCNNTDKMQNVHHKYYTDGKKPWEYPDKCLITLCEDCHEKRHRIDNKFKEFLEVLPAGFGTVSHGNLWQLYNSPKSFSQLLGYVFDSIMNGADETDFFSFMEGWRSHQDDIYLENLKKENKDVPERKWF